MKRSIRLYGEFLCNFLFSDTFLGSAWWFQSFPSFIFFPPIVQRYIWWFFCRGRKVCMVVLLCLLLGVSIVCFPASFSPSLSSRAVVFCDFAVSTRISHTIFRQFRHNFFSSTHSSLIAPRSRMTWCVLCSIFMQTLRQSTNELNRIQQQHKKKLSSRWGKLLSALQSCSVRLRAAATRFFVLALFLALVSEKNVHEEFARIFRISYASQKKENIHNSAKLILLSFHSIYNFSFCFSRVPSSTERDVVVLKIRDMWDVTRLFAHKSSPVVLLIELAFSSSENSWIKQRATHENW